MFVYLYEYLLNTYYFTTKICTLEKYIKCTFGIDNIFCKWRKIHGVKLEIKCEIWMHNEIGENT